MDLIRLGDITSKITKGTTPTSVGYDFVESGINFVKVESISENGEFIEDKFAHISSECNNKLSRSQLEENDILFSIAGAIGRTALVKKSILPANTNQALAIIRLPDGVIDHSYLIYALKSPALFIQYEKKKQGVAQINLSLQNISDFLIPNLPLDEQRKIAAVLDKVSELIAKRRQQLDKLDELIKARFVEMFGDMVLNTKGWSTQPLEEIADIVSGITKGRKVKEQELIEVPYMAVSNVKDGYIDWTTVKTISATHSEIEQYRLLPDDILMTEGGDPDKLGRGAIIQNPPENCIHQNHIFRVRLDETLLLPCYFAEFLKHQKAKQYFLRCAKQTTGIASINMRQLKGLPTLVPPLELQNQFAAFVEQTEKTKITISKSLEKLEILKKALMQKYFGGGKL